LVALLVGAGCSTPLSETECALLLDRYTEKLLRDEKPEVTEQAIAEKQAAARQLAVRDPAFEFAECPNAVSRTQFDCAMQAHNVDGFEQCLTL
jgi:hypothetical protein